MTLVKIEDFYPNYRDELFDGDDIKGTDVYADGTDDKIGTVTDVLVDEDSGRFRYFVIDSGFWVFGKKVLLPVGRSRIDENEERIYATGLTKEQVENLPEFNNLDRIDYDYEDEVRGVYRPQVAQQPDYATSDRDSYNYEQEPSLYGINERDHQTIRLYEERLVANKERYKTGEVAVSKRVETETARVSVPIEKERVVVERTTPADAGRAVTPGEANFREGEMARVEIYEETPDIRKETFVREEVNVRKEVDRDTVDAEETLRREELDLNTQGTSVVDRPRNI
ncbi:DUF2382 domain-containing protein [Argonema antarcticum]|uniref:DUF2382 domain-containing protein n=1 Tax=Argonema antarcticum TaxID=2942763 RepID=UPI0020126F7D|nr:DUF2382 domain-containing protein [Argonema antarcticum]MCL1469937.1 DUF2382 domain-containing protein [Argonema antarcticum A004/B2]